MLFVSATPPGYAQEAATLREVLASGQSAMAAGDHKAAYTAFQRIDEQFGREPEVKEERFQFTVLPVHGYAALLSGNPDRAIELLESFVSRFPDDRSRLSFVLFNLARAYADNGATESAIDTYRRFAALDPHRAEAALATLEAARLLFLAERTEEAFKTLDQMYERQAEGVLRTRARLLALQEAVDRDRLKRARKYLLDTDWEVVRMPELAVLAFSALDMGQRLLTEGAYADAVRCFRLVPPYERLVEAQRQRLTETRQRFESRRDQVGLYRGGQFWTRFYTRLLGRIEGQLRGLESGKNYNTGLYLSLGQAFLLAARPHEAWIVLEHLARDPELAQEEKAKAHYRWILAAIEVGHWEDAFAIARGFKRRFPGSPLAPDSLHLLANAYQEAGRYRDAIQALTAFLDDYPDHSLAPRVLFTRGFNHNVLNQPKEARDDFDTFIIRHPDHGLRPDARFWRGMTYFGERNYKKTLEVLDTLAPDVAGGRLEPVVAYRKAATLYAKRDYETALTAIRAFLENHPNDSRAAEGRVLLGDIQMGRGELSSARSIFSRIPPEAGRLFTYAVFQTGKIFRATAETAERPEQRQSLLERHREHFSNYLERGDVPAKARVSDALYWIGWTHLELDAPDRARKVFADALDTHGDKLDASEVPAIIEGLGRIRKAARAKKGDDPEAVLKEWIKAERKSALEEERLTYYARLNLYLDKLERGGASPDRTGRYIFDTVEHVPIKRLDARGLGRIAAALAAKYPRVAEAYLERLEDNYPDSPHRVYAYFARARLHLHENEYKDARHLLARFRNESPMHPLGIEATLLHAETLTQTGAHGEARKTLEKVLQLRQAKGRTHARALLALSRNAEAAGNLKRAVPYAQRVYTVYRAYPELNAEAYLLNAAQFEALGDIRAAYRTLGEMLADERIARLPESRKAGAELARLESKLPEDAFAETGTAEPPGEDGSQ